MEIQKEEGKLLKKMTGNIIRVTFRLLLGKLVHFHCMAIMRVFGKLF